MLLVITFLLGIGNFALQRAVQNSGHPALDMLPAALRRNGNWALVAEYVVLAGALYLVSIGETGWGWAYFVYSLVNALGAWAILTRRM